MNKIDLVNFKTYPNMLYFHFKIYFYNRNNMTIHEKNILYGGPDPPPIDTESKSLGETLLKTFAALGEHTAFVRVYLSITIIHK